MWDQFYGEQTTLHGTVQAAAIFLLLSGVYSIAYPFRFFRGKVPWRNPDVPVDGVVGWIIEWRVPVSMGCLVLGLFGVTNLTLPKRPFVNPHFAASPYAWTEQCPNHEYRRGEDIPFGCRQARYQIPFAVWTRHGFRHDAPKMAKLYRDNGVEYFRVGNDAIQIVCGWKQQCRVEEMEQDVFRQ